MKQKHILSLLQTGFTTVEVWIAPKEGNVGQPQPQQPWMDNHQPAVPGAPAAPMPPTYTFKASLTDNLVVGDYVVVITTIGIQVGKIMRVDLTPQIDPDADMEYKWIVQKVDLTAHQAKLEQEAQFNAALLEIERQKKRDELQAQFVEQLGEDSAARKLFDGAIQSLNQTIAAPVAPVTPPTPPVQG